MLGGEIYYRAIGRPWGPAVDFIVTVKFHPLSGSAQRLGCWVRSHSRIQVRVRPADSIPVHHPRAARPSRPSVRPSDSDSLSARAAGLPARAPRALVLSVRSCCPCGKPAFRSGTVKKKHQGQPFGTSLYTHYDTYTHRLRTVTNNRKTK
jgi:hypothetical protein